jgi:predicted transcriptional regulator
MIFFVFSSKYKSVVSGYEAGKEKSVSDSVQKRFDVALEITAKKLQMSDFEKNLIKPFVVGETFHANL